MQLIRYQTNPYYNPAASFTGLLEEMDRLFDVGRPSHLPVDLYQDKDAFVIRAELPGFRKEDLSVEAADGVLTIVGHQKAETSDKKEAAEPVRERRVSRSISLPDEVATDKIAARYENGVLTLTLPKREETKPKQIAVEVK